MNDIYVVKISGSVFAGRKLGNVIHAHEITFSEELREYRHRFYLSDLINGNVEVSRVDKYGNVHNTC